MYRVLLRPLFITPPYTWSVHLFHPLINTPTLRGGDNHPTVKYVTSHVAFFSSRAPEHKKAELGTLKAKDGGRRREQGGGGAVVCRSSETPFGIVHLHTATAVTEAPALATCLGGATALTALTSSGADTRVCQRSCW